MSQPSYLINIGSRSKARLIQASDYSAHFEEEMRREMRRSGQRYAGLGDVYRATGRLLRGTVSLHPARDLPILDERGRNGGAHQGTQPEASAAGIKAHLRRLRPQEAAELDRVDLDIQRAQDALALLKQERVELVHQAWKRANVVRLSEVLDKAEADAAKREPVLAQRRAERAS